MYFGFLNCYKPRGLTSRDVVNIVQRRLRQRPDTKGTKIGHCGTLDPLAEGVLVLAVGPAARLVPYVQQQPKHYTARFLLGQSSPTGDLEQEPTRYADEPRPTLAGLKAAAEQFKGSIEQTPPEYSAVWVDGRRAHRRAREGESFEMPRRLVRVHSLEIRAYEFPEVQMEICCGSGTYVRTLGIDMARAVGNHAVMAGLLRTGVGPFRIDQAVSVDSLRDDDLATMLMPPSLGVLTLPWFMITSAQSDRLGHGHCIEPIGAAQWPDLADRDADSHQAAALTSDDQLRAIVRRKGDCWCPYRVFPIDAAV
jgi:tRNA pseudouridine55 synthase